MVMSLAEGLTRHSTGDWGPAPEITVATAAHAGEMDDSRLPFRVVRRPRVHKLVMLLRNADLVHLSGPAFLPALFFGWLMQKRIVVEHHGFQNRMPEWAAFLRSRAGSLPWSLHGRQTSGMPAL